MHTHTHTHNAKPKAKPSAAVLARSCLPSEPAMGPLCTSGAGRQHRQILLGHPQEAVPCPTGEGVGIQSPT